MAINDVVGKTLRSITAGIGLYALQCGGNNLSPTYKGMCTDYNEALISLGAKAETAIRESGECFVNCDPVVLDQQKCAGIYCQIEASTDASAGGSYINLAVLRDCLNGWNSP